MEYGSAYGSLNQVINEGEQMDSMKPLKKDGVLARKTGDEWVLYDSEDKSVHVLNSTAEFVWQLCDGSHTLSDIAKKMHDAFLVPEGTDVEKALDKIIKNFSDLGILKAK